MSGLATQPDERRLRTSPADKLITRIRAFDPESEPGSSDQFPSTDTQIKPSSDTTKSTTGFPRSNERMRVSVVVVSGYVEANRAVALRRGGKLE